MGVRGLTSFMDGKHKQSWKLEEAKNLVIDGQAFLIEFYGAYVATGSLGADYIFFQKRLRAFLQDLQDDGIIASFVFDGSTPREKMETKIQREIEKILFVQQGLSPDSKFSQKCPADQKGPMPLLLVVFGKQLMQTMSICYVTADVEADAPLVAQAQSIDAYIVSNDSDHMLMHGPKGFIRMRDLVRREAGECEFEVLTVSAVAVALSLPAGLLPELASLIGNDYILRDRLTAFHEKVLASLPREDREEKRDWSLIVAVARWLRIHSGNTRPQDATLDAIDEKLLDYSVASYSARGALRDIADSAMHTPAVGFRPQGVEADAGAPAQDVPNWFVKEFRTSPDFPRQLMGLVVDGVHLCPALGEALRVGKDSSAWFQSLPVRAAVALALGLERFEDWRCCLQEHKSGTVEVEYRRQTVELAAFKHLDPLPTHCADLLRSAGGPAESATMEDLQGLASYFLKAHKVRLPAEEFQKHMEEAQPNRGCWVQLLSIFSWVESHKAQWGQPPRWMDLAALVAMTILPPKRRVVIAQGGQAKPAAELTQSVASFEGCLLSGIELHTTLGKPFGRIDFKFLCDSSFLFAVLSSRPILSTTELMEGTEFGHVFTKILLWLLGVLSVHMKPVLRGAAERCLDGGWKFYSAEETPAPQSEAAKQPGDDEQATAKKKKQLEKTLRQIGELAKKSVLNDAERDKVARKPVVEAELAALQAPDVDILTVWGVQREA